MRTRRMVRTPDAMASLDVARRSVSRRRGRAKRVSASRPALRIFRCAAVPSRIRRVRTATVAPAQPLDRVWWTPSSSLAVIVSRRSSSRLSNGTTVPTSTHRFARIGTCSALFVGRVYVGIVRGASLAEARNDACRPREAHLVVECAARDGA
jgi:hypothetical protein